MSAVADPPKLLTAEEFASMPGLRPNTELVKGEVIDVPHPVTTTARSVSKSPTDWERMSFRVSWARSSPTILAS